MSTSMSDKDADKCKNVSEYESKFPVEKRKENAEKIIAKHADRVPVLVQKSEKSLLNDIERFKYLVPRDITLAQFLSVIRKKIVAMNETQAIWLFVPDTKENADGKKKTSFVLAPTSSSMGDLYDKNKSEDAFLRIIYTEENVFGSC